MKSTTPAYPSLADELVADLEADGYPHASEIISAELSRLRAENAGLAKDVAICRDSLEFISRLHIIPPYTSPQAQQLILVKGRADHAMEQTK